MYYYVYVLQSTKDKKLYTGCTNDLKKRLRLYNLGKNLSTKFRRPFRLIYCEVYRNQKDAFEREKFLKTGWGRDYLKRNLKNYFRSKNLGG